MTEPLHVLVYIKRRLGDGRGAPLQLDGFSELSLQRPAGHGFGQPWLFKLASAERPLVIWLFSVLRYNNLCLPPALDARVEVKRAYARANLDSAPPYIKWLLDRHAYVFEPSHPGSCYLPWNHFGPTLNQLIDGASMPAVEPEVQSFGAYSSLMLHFQTPRRLAPCKVAILEAYAKKVLAMPFGFVSYRRKEAPVLAMQAAARLFHCGVAPWWDQWAMPRKVAEEEELCSSPFLETALEEAISNARYAITVHTESYGKFPSTRMELERIKLASQSGTLVHMPLLAPDASLNTPVAAKAAVDIALGTVGLTVNCSAIAAS